jgi:hypothetical protein
VRADGPGLNEGAADFIIVVALSLAKRVLLMKQFQCQALSNDVSTAVILSPEPFLASSSCPAIAL